MAPLARQSQQIDKTESYRDGLTPNVNLEVKSSDLEFDLNAIRTQVKNILGEDNWYDPPKISIKALFESVNRLWFRMESENGFTVPTQEQDTLGIKGASEVSTVATDSGNDTLSLSFSKNVFKTIQTDVGVDLVADNAQDRLFLIGGDEMAITISSHEVTVAFAGADPQDYWGTISGQAGTPFSPTVQQDTLTIVGSNGISTRTESQSSPEVDTLVIESQDFTSGTGSPEFVTVAVTTLEEDEIVYSSLGGFLTGDLPDLNYDPDNFFVGINQSSPSSNFEVQGDVKIHDESLNSIINSTTYSGGTDLLVQNGYVILFRKGPNIFSVFDEYSISVPTLKFQVAQPSEKRIIKGSALRGNFLVTISDPDPANIDTTLGYFDVWDITDFENPTLTASLSSTSFKGAQNLEVHGRYAFFGSSLRIVNVIDLFDIKNPLISYQTNIVDGAGGMVQVVKSTLFAVNNNNNAIDAYDISSLPSVISKKGSSNLLLNSEDIISSVGNYFFSLIKGSNDIVCSVYNFSTNSFTVTDSFSSGLTLPTSALAASGNRVYISSGTGTFESIGVFELQDESLTLLYTESIPNTNTQKIAVAGNKIYIAGTDRFRVLEEKSARLTSAFVSTAKTGNLDVRNKFEITDTLSITGGVWVGPGGVHIDEGYGLGTDSDLNIKDQLLINTISGEAGIEVHSGNIWVTASENHSTYESYENEEIFNKDTAQDVKGIFHKNSIILFESNGISKISKKTGNLISFNFNSNITGGTTSGEIKGDFLFVAPSTVYDIVSYRIGGSSIQEIASKSTGASGSKLIKIVGNVAVIAYSSGGTIRAYDISDPENPVLVDSISVNEAFMDGAVAIDSEDNFVYVAYKSNPSPNPGYVAIVKIQSVENRNFQITNVETSTFALSTTFPYAIKAYRNNLIVVPENQGAMYVYDTQNKSSVNLLATKVIRPGTPIFSGRYLWQNDSGVIRVYDYLPALNDFSVEPKYLFMTQNGQETAANNSILCDGDSYYIFGNEGFVKYRQSHAQFDTMELGATVAQEIKVKKDFVSRNSIEAQNVSIGKNGLISRNNMKTTGSSSFLGRASVGKGTSDHQLYVLDKAIQIDNVSGFITSEARVYDSTSALDGDSSVRSFAGGYAAFGSWGSSAITINDFRFENYMSVNIGALNLSTGDLSTFSMKGDYLFVHTDSQEIEIRDISRKSNETFYPVVGAVSTGKDYTDSMIWKNYLVLIDSADSGSTIDFYDITDASNPILFSTNSIPSILGAVRGFFEYRGMMAVVYHESSGDSTLVLYRLEDNGTLTSVLDFDDIDDVMGMDISRDYAYVLENDGVAAYITSLYLSEYDVGIFVSDKLELSSTYPKKITVRGKYAILSDNEGNSNQVIIVDISDPSNMIEREDNSIISDGILGSRFYGSSLVLDDEAGFFYRANLLGYKGQRGYVGSFSVDELLVSQDLNVLESSSFYGGAFIGKGGVHVDQGNGIGTDGRFISTGRASFGHTDITVYDLSARGDVSLNPSSFAYGNAIYEFAWNSNRGFLFAHNGVLYPLVKNAWLYSISITGRTRAVDEEVSIGSLFSQGFDGPNTGSDIALSGKYLFMIEFQNQVVRVYDFENFREDAAPIASIDYSQTSILPTAIVLNGNTLYVLSGYQDATPRIISYRYRIENESFVIEEVGQYLVPNMSDPKCAIYHKQKIFIGDEDFESDPIHVIDVSDLSNMTKINASIQGLSEDATVISLCSAGNYVHILYEDQGNNGYLKISDIQKEGSFPQEQKNTTISVFDPRKIICFGRYVAIWERVSGGDDKVFVLDTDQENAPVISTLTNSNLENIEDLLFYRDAIYVLGTGYLYPIEVQSANVTNADIESIVTDSFITKDLEVIGTMSIGGGVYTPSNMNSDGIGRISGSMYVGNSFSIGSTEKSNTIGGFIYGKDMLQESTEISYLGSDGLESSSIGGIAIDNERIYNFDEYGGEGTEFRVNDLSGTNVIPAGFFTVTGLQNNRFAAASNGYIYCLDNQSNLYCLSFINENASVLSQTESPTRTYHKSPSGFIVNGDLAVAIYDNQFAAYDISDPYNIQGKFWRTGSAPAIKEISFHGRKVQELTESFTFLLENSITIQYLRYFNSDLNGLQGTFEENYIIRKLISGSLINGFSEYVVSAYRDGHLIYGLKEDGSFGVARIEESTNSISFEIDSIQLAQETISQGRIVRYGENLIVFTDKGAAVINIQNKTSLSLKSWVSNESEGFDNPFGPNFEVHVIGTKIFYIRDNELYKMALKGSSISHIEAGSFSTVNLMNYSDIDVGEDVYLGSVLAGGHLSVPSEFGITTNHLNANRIVVNKQTGDASGYKETDWAFEVLSGETVGESPRIEDIGNISAFDSGNAGVMVPVGNEIYVFSSDTPYYSVVSMIGTDSPEVYDSATTNTVLISDMAATGVVAAFALGRKVYAVSSIDGQVFSIDSLTKEQFSVSNLPLAAGYRGHLVVSNYLYWANSSSVTRYIIENNSLIENGSYSTVGISGIEYGEGVLFLAYISGGDIEIKVLGCAQDSFGDSIISTEVTGFSESFIDLKYYRNKLYLLSSDGSDGIVRSASVTDTGALISFDSPDPFQTIINSADILNAIKVEVFEDKICLLEDNSSRTISVYDISGVEDYVIESEVEAFNCIVYRNKVWITTEDDSRVYIYKFRNSNFSIGEFGSVVAGALEITNKARFTEGASFRNGLQSMGTVFSNKEISSSQGFSGQAIISMKRNSNTNVIGSSLVHATNLSGQTVDLFFSKDALADYVDFEYESLSGAFEVDPANGSTGFSVNIKGLYQIKFTGSIYRTISGPIELHLSKNNQSVDSHAFYVENTANPDGHHISCSFLVEIAAGDTIKLFGIRSTNSGAPITFQENSMLHIEKIS